MTIEKKSEQTLEQWEARLAAILAQNTGDDASHDVHHAHRVWHVARQIAEGESRPSDLLTILAACYMHDVVTLPKDHPERSTASTLAAAKTREILQQVNFPADKIENVCHAVKAHSFSAGIPTETTEAEIVQDADRMEAIGAIGLARVFYTSGRMKRSMFDPVDPLAENRELNDQEFALDHFQCKLLKLAGSMKTEGGKKIAQERTEYLRDYMRVLCQELFVDFNESAIR
ncbi:HD domain-containing protein [Spongorhabdus nitratireducens]